MQPSTAINRFDLAMSVAEFNLEMNRDGYIGHRVLPPIPVAKQSSSFARIPIEALLTPNIDTKRAPRAGYKRDGFEWETDNYDTADHGFEEPIDDRMLKMYGSEIRAEAIARQRVAHVVKQAYEIAVATLVLANSNTQAATTAWTTRATADPIADIDSAREAFISQCGMKPNALVMEHKALVSMIRTARLEDLIKYSGNTDPTAIRRAIPQLQELLQIDQIIVADSPVKNTAARGKAATMGRVWDQTKVLMARISNGMDLEAPEAQLGRTIMWSEEGPGAPGADDDGIGLVFEEYREENVRGGVLRGRTDYVPKILHEAAGLVITGVTA